MFGTVEAQGIWALSSTLVRSDVYRIADQARFLKHVLVMNAATLDQVARVLRVQPCNVGSALGVTVDVERGVTWPDGVVTSAERR